MESLFAGLKQYKRDAPKRRADVRADLVASLVSTLREAAIEIGSDSHSVQRDGHRKLHDLYWEASGIERGITFATGSYLGGARHIQEFRVCIRIVTRGLTGDSPNTSESLQALANQIEALMGVK